MPESTVMVFDVNETLSDVARTAQRFPDIGLAAQLAQTWFAQVLRDGFALVGAGTSAPLPTIAAGHLCGPFTQLARDGNAAIQHVLNGLPSLWIHTDVAARVPALASGGRRPVS